MKPKTIDFDGPEYITLEEASNLSFWFSCLEIERWMKEGDFQAKKIDGKYMINTKSFLDYIREGDLIFENESRMERIDYLKELKKNGGV